MSIPDTTTKDNDMNKIQEIEAAAVQSCEGIKEALSLIHTMRIKEAAHTSVDNIVDAIKALADLADDAGLEDKMLDHPDFISRSHLEREVDYSTVELYGENYVKVQDLYDLFKAPDSNQAELYDELS